jgi:hypothetical protein
MMMMASAKEPKLRDRQHVDIRIGKVDLTIGLKVTTGAFILAAGLAGMLVLAFLHWKVVVPLVFLIGTAAAGKQQTDRKGKGKKHERSRPHRPDRYV